MSRRTQDADGYQRTPPHVARAITAAMRVADFLPDPRSLRRVTKRTVTLRLDPDVVEWFRGAGAGYQTRMNAVLRAYMLAKSRH